MDAPFGQTPVGPVRRLTVGRAPGLEVDVLDLGATLHAVRVDDLASGVRRNVVRSLPDAQAYYDSIAYVGAIVGRYANRIAGARAELDGRELVLGPNEGRHVLHGGPDGYDKRIWDVVEHDDDHVALRLVSPDGDQGFPGGLTATATYAVAGTTMTLELTATTDAATFVSLTSHGYWNLDESADIDDHVLEIRAERYLPVDDELIPTGEQRPVHDEFDLREPQRIGDRFLDHNFVLEVDVPQVTLLGEHLALLVTTDAPGLQVHTADEFPGSPRAGLALEPQLFPDSPHHADFPSTVLRPGETFRSFTTWEIAQRGTAL